MIAISRGTNTYVKEVGYLLELKDTYSVFRIKLVCSY